MKSLKSLKGISIEDKYKLKQELQSTYDGQIRSLKKLLKLKEREILHYYH